MAEMKAVMFTASIENEAAIRDWMRSVGDAASQVQKAIDDLSNQLRDAPHISIQLNRSDPDAE